MYKSLYRRLMSLIKRDYSNLKRDDTEDQPLKNRKK